MPIGSLVAGVRTELSCLTWDLGTGSGSKHLTIASSPWSAKHDALVVGLCFSWSFPVLCVVVPLEGAWIKARQYGAWLHPQSLLWKRLSWVRTFTPGKIFQIKWRPRKSLHSALLWEDIWWEQSSRILEKQMMGSCYLLSAVLRWSAHTYTSPWALIVSVHRNYWNAKLCLRISFFW